MTLPCWRLGWVGGAAGSPPTGCVVVVEVDGEGGMVLTDEVGARVGDSPVVAGCEARPGGKMGGPTGPGLDG